MRSGSRDEMLDRLVEEITSTRVTHPTRVAVDGPPAAGKTTLADELATVLRAAGRTVIRSTIEGFLFVRAQRYQRGDHSAEGCYFDTHDYDALNRVLLDPLGPNGNRQFQPAVYDKSRDVPISPPIATASEDTILIFDGVFLLRPEVNDRWDLRILVLTDFEETVDRAKVRERAALPAAAIERRWRERYIPSQQFYFTTVRPAEHADVIVENDTIQRPSWEIRSR